MIELVVRAAEEHPQRRGGPRPTTSRLTYADLLSRRPVDRGRPGARRRSRASASSTSRRRWSCRCWSGPPSPAPRRASTRRPTPTRSPRSPRRFDHDVLVSDRDDLAARLPSVDLVRTTAWLDGPRLGGDLPDQRPHLVLTTGTTGLPRGVRHDWSRLVRGVDGLGHSPDQRWLLAYGLHQFAGLQIVQHVLATGGHAGRPGPAPAAGGARRDAVAGRHPRERHADVLALPARRAARRRRPGAGAAPGDARRRGDPGPAARPAASDVPRRADLPDLRRVGVRLERVDPRRALRPVGRRARPRRRRRGRPARGRRRAVGALAHRHARLLRRAAGRPRRVATHRRPRRGRG